MPKKDVVRRIDSGGFGLTPVISGGPTSGGVSGVTDHGLLTGLGDDDHLHYHTNARGDARYALRSRTLTAGAGLTGGGDLTADRTLAVGAGAGITVNANDVALASSVAGDGLTYSGGVLDVGAGAGLTVAANSIALTTPGGLAWNSANSAAGNHTHAVASSADVGTTPAEALLRSTGAGGLTLKSLAVKGSVDITDGGDLYVAGSGSYAGLPVLFADSSGGNVGILRVPDSQFTLDVAGPLRAQYLVGKAAIEVRDVTFLCQFNGWAPYWGNQYGEPNGHMGQVAQTAGGLYFRQGKFDKGVVVASATTNYVPNPRAANGTTGWTFSEGGSGGGLFTTNYLNLSDGEEAGLIGSTAFRLLSSSGANNAFAVTAGLVSVANGASVALSCRVRKYSANTGYVGIYDVSNTVLRASVNVAALADVGWQYVTVTWTNTTGAAATVRVQINNSAGGNNVNLLFTECQLEARAFSTPYCDGSLPGHTWSGTAHNSSSSRSNAALTYEVTGNVPTAAGTVMGWVLLSNNSQINTLFRCEGATAGTMVLRTNGAGAEAQWGTTAALGGGTIAAATWTHLTMTYNGATLRLYVNGVEVASGAASGFDGAPATFALGRTLGGSQFLDGMIDSFCVVNRVLPAAEVRSIYESNAPVFAVNSVFVFRATPTGLVWADAEGLWMRDTAGNAVLGVYGGAAATKSWGGQTLEAGDFLLGRGAKTLLWDASAGNLILTGDIYATGGSFTGVIDIGASGGIYQGTGSFAAPTTGLKLWNQSGVGRIAGYNDGDWQWQGATDGKFYFGGGNGRLSADGIDLVTYSSFASFYPYNTIWWRRNGSEDTVAWIGCYTPPSAPHARELYIRTTDATLSGETTSIYIEAGDPGSVGISAGAFGGLVINSPAGISSLYDERVELSSVVAIGHHADGVARVEPMFATTLNDGQVLNLGDPVDGLAIIYVGGQKRVGMVELRGASGATVLVDPNNVFSNAKNTSGRTNVYHESGTMRIQNLTAATRTYSVFLLGAVGTF